MINIGIPGLLLIVVLALFIFGPNRLPELGRAIGETIREFKQIPQKISDKSDGNENEQKV